MLLSLRSRNNLIIKQANNLKSKVCKPAELVVWRNHTVCRRVAGRAGTPMAGAVPLTQYTWSNDSVFELIDMVRERPVLWDSSQDDHRDRMKKQAAWREIADHFGLDKSVVEKKMRMMIGQYRREMSRIAGGDTSKWFAFQKLSFLSGMQDFNGSTFPPITTVHVGSTHSRGDQNSHDLLEDRSLVPTMYDEEDYSEDSTTCQKTFTTPVEPRAKRPKLDAKRAHDRTSSTDTIVKMLYEEKKARDEFVVYGEYVANKLRNIQSAYAKNTAQFHINNILYRAETGQFDVFKPLACPEKPSGPAGRALGPEGQGTRWDNESVTSIPESTHSLDDSTRIECVQIKLEN